MRHPATTRNGAYAVVASAEPSTSISVASSHATSAILPIGGVLVWVVSTGRQPSIMILSDRMILARPSSDPVLVLRTRAIRVPSGEILNAVTVLEHR